jgi:hypothetical protein
MLEMLLLKSPQPRCQFIEKNNQNDFSAAKRYFLISRVSAFGTEHLFN